MGTKNHLQLYMFCSTLLITVTSVLLLMIIGKTQSDKLLRDISTHEFIEHSNHQAKMMEDAVNQQVRLLRSFADNILPQYLEEVKRTAKPAETLQKPFTTILQSVPSMNSSWFVFGKAGSNLIRVTIAEKHDNITDVKDKMLNLSDKMFSYNGYLYDSQMSEPASKTKYLVNIMVKDWSDWQASSMLRILVRVENNGEYLGILGVDYTWNFFSHATSISMLHSGSSTSDTFIFSTSSVRFPQSGEETTEPKSNEWLKYIEEHENSSKDNSSIIMPAATPSGGITIFTPLNFNSAGEKSYIVNTISHAQLVAHSQAMDAAMSWGIIGCLLFAICGVIGISLLLRTQTGKFSRWFNQILNSMTVPMFITDLSGKIEFISPKAIEIFSKDPHIAPQKLFGKNALEMLDLNIEKEQGCSLYDLPKNEDNVAYCNSKGVNYAIRSRYISNASGDKNEIVTIFSDITQWKAIEQIMEASACGIALIDAETFEVKSINRAGLEINGFRRKSDVIGQSCKDTVCLARGEKPCEKCTIGGKRQATESFLGPDGEIRHALSVTTHAIIGGREYYVETFVDITRQKEIELQLSQRNNELERLNSELKKQDQHMVHQEKMASIGQLAAGVAHEINNPIGYVSSNLRTLKEYITIFHNLFTISEELIGNHADPKAVKNTLEKMADIAIEEDVSFVLEDSQTLVEESIDGMNRVRDIVKNLKSFARPDETTHKETDLNAQLEATLKMVYNELKYKCNIIKDYGEIPTVVCSPGEISQVFMNLLVNASHAIDDKGDIIIRTWQEEDNVHISISDTGCGVSPENLIRIFDPFFTTKEVGKGTGLGLAISHGIIQKHNGEITVKSVPGEGTTFTIVLPIGGIGQPEDTDSGSEDIRQ